eukprot:COSAG05_NODE_2838_length_2582_cov_2.943617_2_plen_92_part_00
MTVYLSSCWLAPLLYVTHITEGTARANVLYGGGHKNYAGQNKNASGNLFLYPELSDQLASFDRFQGCMASDGTPTLGEVFEDNVCVVHDGS